MLSGQRFGHDRGTAYKSLSQDNKKIISSMPDLSLM
jgi:hypothetical protein